MFLKDVLKSNVVKFNNNIYYFTDYIESEFNNQYSALREKEGRIYDDNTVLNLPRYSGENENLKKEWKLRKISADRLKNYINKQYPKDTILEIGCGNGWLCHYLSTENNVIYGLDINHKELIQAGNLFYKNNRTEFLFGDLFQINFPPNSFDIIILGSSIQYFSDLQRLLYKCKELLAKKGEIHILDTHIYKEDVVELAKHRSELYFNQMGFPQMSKFYFHHSQEELKKYKPIFLYNPDSLIQKVKSKTSHDDFVPFPWIKIAK